MADRLRKLQSWEGTAERDGPGENEFSDEEDDFYPLSQTDNPRVASSHPRRRASSNLSFSDSNGRDSDSVGAAADSGPGAGAEAGAWAGGDDLWAVVDEGPVLATKRTIRDRVHGQIELDPFLVALVDTPQYQRLRGLQQLGGTSYVYPGACHSRFEHSLGVSHLAGQMVEHLRRTQEELDLTEADVLCVRVAALCHDLGHGPFSHTFEVFVNRIRESELKEPWHHERASIALFDELIEANEIPFAAYGLTTEDLNLVKLLIQGMSPSDKWPADLGRDEGKRFLFDIVANKRNGIDVDKLDYFLRDSIAALGSPPISCDVVRLIRCCRVFTVDGQTQICFEEKMALGLFDIFKLRAWLHKYLYQHHTVNVVEEMICDALAKANEHFHVRGSGEAKVRISDTVDDMTAFSQLGDWILSAIEASCDAAMRLAQVTVQRVRARNLYSQVLQPTHVPADQRWSEADVKAAILKFAPQEEAQWEHLDEDTLIHFVKINYGSKDAEGRADNPILHVRFFNPKDAQMRGYPIRDRNMPDLFTPKAFAETLVYVYVRDDRSLESLEMAYLKWRSALSKRLAAASKAGAGSKMTLTPLALGNPQSPRKRRRVSQNDA